MLTEKVSEKPNTVVGILAHVDAGKTTLSEQILFRTGVLRKTGRVDHGDTAMDSHALEKERGITIFASQANFSVDDRRFTLLDTPGHVDFSPEMERTLSVLDAAILVLSGTDVVQSHTRTLWRLLSLYQVPTFIFVTKMDYAISSREAILKELQSEFGEQCIDFTAPFDVRNEKLAVWDEKVLQNYFESGVVADEDVAGLVSRRSVFPVYFGSGLKGDGVDKLLSGLSLYSTPCSPAEDFGAKVFKITHDESDNKVVHLKVTGGTLSVKDVLGDAENGEKINQMRLYNGAKFIPVDKAFPGDVVSVIGPKNLKCGDEIGETSTVSAPVIEPVMRYTVLFEAGVNPTLVLPKFRLLEEEDPMLKVSWNSFLSEIQVGLMGQVHAEVLKRVVLDRLHLNVDFVKGHVLYKETITAPVEGVGHYEPLRHYAEVHLFIEPGPRGSGIVLKNRCDGDLLDKSYQHLAMTHLAEKEHLGVLTGSPLTDVKITLVSGRAHVKHTEGGDFRQATYRAVRQGLMCTSSKLLEPYFRFRLELPSAAMNRAINDIRQMGGVFDPPTYEGAVSVLIGRAPVSEMNDYAKDVASFSGGAGKLFVEMDGYDLCHNEEEVIASFQYQPEADSESSPDSIFCDHGAGFLVHWNDVPKYMHIEYQKERL